MRVTRDLDLAAHRIHNAERTIPSVLAHLDELRAHVGTRAANETGITTRGHNDPVAAAAAALADIDTRRRRIDEAAQLILRAIDHFDLQCRIALGNPHAAEDVSRCPGYPIAGRDCGDITAHKVDPNTRDVVLRADRLCDRCGIEADRDERARRRAHNERMRRHNPKEYRL